MFFPLNGEGVLFFAVALLACGDQVVLCRPAASYDRDDMVHGEVSGREFQVAVVTSAFSEFAFPPLCLAEIAGLLLFLPYLLFGNC